MYENVSYVFSDKSKLIEYGFSSINEKLELTNPIAEDMNTLRSTILINLLEAVKRNVNYTQKSIALFEIGAVFNELRAQRESLAIIFSGQEEQESIINSGKPKAIDFGSFVKRVSLVIGEFELISCREVNGLIHPYQSADIVIKGKKCGYVSKLHPTVQDSYDIPATFFAEIDFEALLPEHINAKAISKFQGVHKDLSLVIDKSINYSLVREAISTLDLDLLQSYYPIDVYSDEELGDKKSLTVRFLIQSAEKTLSESDIEAVMIPIIEKLEESCQAKLR
jgi:phenylalanyl-tRNA synthetase beta chain